MKSKINLKKDCKCIGGMQWDLRQKSIEETVRIDKLHTKVFCNRCGGYLGYLNERCNFKRDTRSKSITRQIGNMSNYSLADIEARIIRTAGSIQPVYPPLTDIDALRREVERAVGVRLGGYIPEEARQFLENMI